MRFCYLLSESFAIGCFNLLVGNVFTAVWQPRLASRRLKTGLPLLCSVFYYITLCYGEAFDDGPANLNSFTPKLLAIRVLWTCSLLNVGSWINITVGEILYNWLFVCHKYMFTLWLVCMFYTYLNNVLNIVKSTNTNCTSVLLV